MENGYALVFCNWMLRFSCPTLSHRDTIVFRVVLLYPYILLILFSFACISLYLLDLPDISTLGETVGTKPCSAMLWSVPNSASICSVRNTLFLMYAQSLRSPKQHGMSCSIA